MIGVHKFFILLFRVFLLSGIFLYQGPLSERVADFSNGDCWKAAQLGLSLDTYYFSNEKTGHLSYPFMHSTLLTAFVWSITSVILCLFVLHTNIFVSFTVMQCLEIFSSKTSKILSTTVAKVNRHVYKNFVLQSGCSGYVKVSDAYSFSKYAEIKGFLCKTHPFPACLILTSTSENISLADLKSLHTTMSMPIVIFWSVAVDRISQWSY